MKIKLSILTVFLAVSGCIPFSGVTTLAVAQTSTELKSRYPSVEIYEMRPDVWLTPKFADDGQTCEVSLEKRNRSTFSQREIDELTNELVPASAGGPEEKYLGSDSFIAGGSSAIEHVFKNVSITEYGAVSRGVGLVVIQWKNRPCSKANTNLKSK